jgi:hypothetical protein
MPSRRHPTRWWRALALLASAAPALLGAQVNRYCDRPQDLPTPTPFAPGGSPVSWDSVAAFVGRAGIRFMDPQTDSVMPCRGSGCRTELMTLATEAHTNCLTSAMMRSGEMYFAGVVVQPAGSVANGLVGFNSSNVTDTVYLMVRDSQAVAMYRTTRNRALFLPHVPSNSGWQFYFSGDGMYGQPAAQWKKTGFGGTMDESAARAQMRVRKEGGPAEMAFADGEDALQTEYTYGWMQCAGGCCQFMGTGDGGQQGHGQHPGVGNPPPPNPGPPHPSRR